VSRQSALLHPQHALPPRVVWEHRMTMRGRGPGWMWDNTSRKTGWLLKVHSLHICPLHHKTEEKPELPANDMHGCTFEMICQIYSIFTNYIYMILAELTNVPLVRPMTRLVGQYSWVSFLGYHNKGSAEPTPTVCKAQFLLLIWGSGTQVWFFEWGNLYACIACKGVTSYLGKLLSRSTRGCACVVRSVWVHALCVRLSSQLFKDWNTERARNYCTWAQHVQTGPSNFLH